MTINKAETPRTFRTKEGYCLVFQNRLVFSKTEDGVITAEDKKDYTGCALFIFAILSLFFLKAAFGNFFDGNYFAGSMWLLAAIFTGFCLFSSWNSRDAAILKRRDIATMKLTRHSSVYKNSYIDIYYNRFGRKRDMRLELKGSLKYADADARNAIRILIEEGLLVQDGVVQSGMPYESITIAYQQELMTFYEQNPTLFEWAEIAEIREAEQQMDTLFPISFMEYLAVAGNGNRMQYDEIEFFALSKLESRNRELGKKLKLNHPDLFETVPFVTFAFRDGRYLYVRLDAGFDPKVYAITADKTNDATLPELPVVIAGTFSGFIGDAIKAQA